MAAAIVDIDNLPKEIRRADDSTVWEWDPEDHIYRCRGCKVAWTSTDYHPPHGPDCSEVRNVAQARALAETA